MRSFWTESRVGSRDILVAPYIVSLRVSWAVEPVDDSRDAWMDSSDVALDMVGDEVDGEGRSFAEKSGVEGGNLFAFLE